jgi:hypothetical protein
MLRPGRGASKPNALAGFPPHAQKRAPDQAWRGRELD